MTPEKLEAWEKLFRGAAEEAARVLDKLPESFDEAHTQRQRQYINDYRELADFHATLAAKMREPDGWVCTYVTEDDRLVTVVHDEPDEYADSERPILYLDSLEGDDE